MLKLKYFVLFFVVQLSAQKSPISVITEEIPNRLAFYAINESTTDYDVKVTISGTNIRQSKALPRLIRVPGASKVHIKNIMLIRGKKPAYSHKLYINDSLSKRAMKKPFKKIKIKPKKQITLYIPNNCVSCDSILTPLKNGLYKFNVYVLSDNEEMKNQLQRSFGSTSTPVDSLKVPIVNLGGKLYKKIDTYKKLEEELEKE